MFPSVRLWNSASTIHFVPSAESNSAVRRNSCSGTEDTQSSAVIAVEQSAMNSSEDKNLGDYVYEYGSYAMDTAKKTAGKAYDMTCSALTSIREFFIGC